jgi:hypothetical protein
VGGVLLVYIIHTQRAAVRDRERQTDVDTFESRPKSLSDRERGTEGERRANATWSTSSFTSYHGQLLSLAVQWGVAIEIERAIKKSARFC